MARKKRFPYPVEYEVGPFVGVVDQEDAKPGPKDQLAGMCEAVMPRLCLGKRCDSDCDMTASFRCCYLPGCACVRGLNYLAKGQGRHSKSPTTRVVYEFESRPGY